MVNFHVNWHAALPKTIFSDPRNTIPIDMLPHNAVAILWIIVSDCGALVNVTFYSTSIDCIEFQFCSTFSFHLKKKSFRSFPLHSTVKWERGNAVNRNIPNSFHYFILIKLSIDCLPISTPKLFDQMTLFPIALCSHRNIICKFKHISWALGGRERRIKSHSLQRPTRELFASFFLLAAFYHRNSSVLFLSMALSKWQKRGHVNGLRVNDR